VVVQFGDLGVDHFPLLGSFVLMEDDVSIIPEVSCGVEELLMDCYAPTEAGLGCLFVFDVELMLDAAPLGVWSRFEEVAPSFLLLGVTRRLILPIFIRAAVLFVKDDRCFQAGSGLLSCNEYLPLIHAGSGGFWVINEFTPCRFTHLVHVVVQRCKSVKWSFGLVPSHESLVPRYRGDCNLVSDSCYEVKVDGVRVCRLLEMFYSGQYRGSVASDSNGALLNVMKLADCVDYDGSTEYSSCFTSE
jgi:hypothetical protein